MKATVLILLDAMRWDYIDKNTTPFLPLKSQIMQRNCRSSSTSIVVLSAILLPESMFGPFEKGGKNHGPIFPLPKFFTRFGAKSATFDTPKSGCKKWARST